MNTRYEVVDLDTGKVVSEHATENECALAAKKLNREYFKARFAGSSGGRRYVGRITHTKE